MNEERKIENISIYRIIPNIYQPRIKFDDKSITELANSIKAHGIIQPLILRKIGDSYEIIDGERRYKAAKKVGLEQVPSIILNIDDKEAAELILTENMQKQLLTPIEEANAYQQIMLLNKFDINEMSNKIGKEKSIIENKLKLLTLPAEIQEALLNNKIAEGHAKALTKVNSKEQQIKLYERVLKERIPVKVLEEIINKEINLKTDEKVEDISQNKEGDIISLNDLNKSNFFITQKEKMEDEKMDNTQMNFNQYNNLLKGQEKAELGITLQPEPILGNIVSEPSKNDFFPSLEEQPLNMDIPMANRQDIPVSVQMPPLEAFPQNMPMMESTRPIQQSEMSSPEASQIFGMPGQIEMPQFEAPMQNIELTNPVQQATIPSIEVPQMPEMPVSAQMPQFEASVSNMELPGTSMTMPQPAVQTMEPPQIFEMPEFNMSSPNVAMAEQPIIAPQTTVPPVDAPIFEMPSPVVETSHIELPTQNITAPAQQNTTHQPVMTNVMPAVNMIRNLIPLLENSGYKINIEEADNPSEYQIVLKVEK